MQDTATGQDFFRVLFMDDALPKFIYDAETLRFLEVNHAAVEVYGYSREEFLDMSVLDIRPPEHEARVRQLIKEAGDRKARHKTLHHTRSGREVSADIYSQSIEFDGQRARMATVVDMTVRELARHELHNSHTLLQAIIDNVPEPVLIKDLAGRFVFINRAGARAHGLEREPEDVIGHTARELSGPAAAPFDEHDREVIQQRTPSARVVETVVNGEMRKLHVSKSPWLDAEGELRGVLGIVRDITEQERATAAVTKAQRRYRDLFERMTKGVVYQDANGAITDANPAAERILGMSLEEMQQHEELQSSFVVIRDDGTPCPLDEQPSMVALRTGREVTNVILGARHPDSDDVRWLLVNSVPEFDEGADTPNSVFSTFNDITRLRATEQALRASQGRLEILMRQLPAILWTTDVGLRITWSDGAGYKTVGLSPELTLGRSIAEFMPNNAVAENHLLALEGQGSSYEANFRGRVMRFTLEPLRDRNGNIDGVLGIALDVTDRAEAEQEARSNEERFRALVEHATEMLVIADPDGVPTFTSVSTQNVIGFSSEELAEFGNLWSILHPDDLPRVRKIYEHVFASPGEPVTYQARVCHKDGGWRHMEVVARNMLRHPVIRGVILNVRDITAKHDAEHRLRDSEEQLRQAQKMEAVGRLAGGIAHDFNNVLTAITGHADLLSEMFSSFDPRMKDVDEIKRAADRATSLTRQLLAFSRRQVMQPVVLDLGCVVTDMRKMLERLIGADITLDWTIERSVHEPAVHADRTQLEQVLLNLVVNARDAMPDGGTLSVGIDVVEANGAFANASGVVPDGSYVRLTVTDTGGGISPENLPKIFEPFFTTKDRSRGTGLGLSTVYGIVQQSGGHICVKSRPGVGTRFDVLLPRVDSALPEAKQMQTVTLETPLRGSETILLVEDEPAVRSMAERILRRHGYHVLSAADGAQALALADAAPGISLLITDVVMPTMSGRELAQEFAQRHPGVRVLFMSGYTYDEIAGQAMVKSELEFLSKPFTPDALARKVRAVLAA